MLFVNFFLLNVFTSFFLFFFLNLINLKVINGERAALHGCPNFKNKLIAARRVQLEELEKNYGKKK